MTYAFDSEKFWQKAEINESVGKLLKSHQEYENVLKHNVGFVDTFNQKAEDALHKMLKNLTPSQLKNYIKTGEAAVSIEATPSIETADYYNVPVLKVKKDLQNNFLQTSSVFKAAKDAFRENGVELYTAEYGSEWMFKFGYDLAAPPRP